MNTLQIIDKCPCCGEVAIMKYHDGAIQTYYGLPHSFIQCQGCGLRTDYGSEDENISVWNRRIYNETTII